MSLPSAAYGPVSGLMEPTFNVSAHAAVLRKPTNTVATRKPFIQLLFMLPPSSFSF
jgi:hypothetical protein